MNDLPRNMSLKAFNPHREDFVCKHEAEVVPPIDPETEQWFQQGMAVTSLDLPEQQRDYNKATELWQRAAVRNHWKAMLNLATLYVDGTGVQRDTEQAVLIVERAMKLGIPGAYDLMGTYHMNGTGVKQDASRAYAFWELAADMGSPSAMAYLGSRLSGTYSNPKEGFWGNRPVALKMLECGAAQGSGRAAFELGLVLDGDDASLGKSYARSLLALHAAVKMGEQKAAGYLFASFDDGLPLVGGIKDTSRSRRYREFSEALRYNPDLRFPNLDKVLPLPPAELPQWDGDEQTLIDAAKGIVPTPRPATPPPPPPAPRTGRAFIPEGHTLPEQPQIAVSAQFETTAAPESGYWLAKLMRATSERHQAWNAAQLPQRYEQGELFDRTRPGLVPEDGRIQFHYRGQPVPVPVPPAPVLAANPRVAQGIAREAELPLPLVQCRGDQACPATGIWQGRVADAHPHAASFNQWHRQAYVSQGAQFPDPRAQHLDVAPQDILWIWWNQANHLGFADIPQVSVGNPPAAT